MKKILFAIKDTKSEFMHVATAVNENIAKRQYKMLIDDKESEIGAFPSDFELWQVGTYETSTGEIKPNLKLLATAATINLKKGVE